MTREERLKFCTICKKQTKDFKQGLVCSLTGTKADFEDKCVNFEIDESKSLERIKKRDEYANNGVSGSIWFLVIAGLNIIGAVLVSEPAVIIATAILALLFVWTYFKSRNGELWAFIPGWIFLSIFALFGFLASGPFGSFGFMSLAFMIGLYCKNPFFSKSAWETTTPFKWSVSNVLYIVLYIIYAIIIFAYLTFGIISNI